MENRFGDEHPKDPRFLHCRMVGSDAMLQLHEIRRTFASIFAVQYLPGNSAGPWRLEWNEPSSGHFETQACPFRQNLCSNDGNSYGHQ